MGYYYGHGPAAQDAKVAEVARSLPPKPTKKQVEDAANAQGVSAEAVGRVRGSIDSTAERIQTKVSPLYKRENEPAPFIIQGDGTKTLIGKQYSDEERKAFVESQKPKMVEKSLDVKKPVSINKGLVGEDDSGGLKSTKTLISKTQQSLQEKEGNLIKKLSNLESRRSSIDLTNRDEVFAFNRELQSANIEAKRLYAAQERENIIKSSMQDSDLGKIERLRQEIENKGLISKIGQKIPFVSPMFTKKEQEYTKAVDEYYNKWYPVKSSVGEQINVDSTPPSIKIGSKEIDDLIKSNITFSNIDKALTGVAQADIKRAEGGTDVTTPAEKESISKLRDKSSDFMGKEISKAQQDVATFAIGTGTIGSILKYANKIKYIKPIAKLISSKPVQTAMWGAYGTSTALRGVDIIQTPSGFEQNIKTAKLGTEVTGVATGVSFLKTGKLPEIKINKKIKVFPETDGKPWKLMPDEWQIKEFVKSDRYGNLYKSIEPKPVFKSPIDVYGKARPKVIDRSPLKEGDLLYSSPFGEQIRYGGSKVEGVRPVIDENLRVTGFKDIDYPGKTLAEYPGSGVSQERYYAIDRLTGKVEQFKRSDIKSSDGELFVKYKDQWIEGERFGNWKTLSESGRSFKIGQMVDAVEISSSAKQTNFDKYINKLKGVNKKSNFNSQLEANLRKRLKEEKPPTRDFLKNDKTLQTEQIQKPIKVTELMRGGITVEPVYEKYGKPYTNLKTPKGIEETKIKSIKKTPSSTFASPSYRNKLDSKIKSITDVGFDRRIGLGLIQRDRFFKSTENIKDNIIKNKMTVTPIYDFTRGVDTEEGLDITQTVSPKPMFDIGTPELYEPIPGIGGEPFEYPNIEKIIPITSAAGIYGFFKGEKRKPRTKRSIREWVVTNPVATVPELKASGKLLLQTNRKPFDFNKYLKSLPKPKTKEPEFDSPLPPIRDNPNSRIFGGASRRPDFPQAFSRPSRSFSSQQSSGKNKLQNTVVKMMGGIKTRNQLESAIKSSNRRAFSKSSFKRRRR